MTIVNRTTTACLFTLTRREALQLICLGLVVPGAFTGCGSDDTPPSWTTGFGTREIKVILDEIPYRTDRFVRIGYTFKAWEWEKEGLKLERIVVLAGQTGAALKLLDGDALPFIYRDPYWFPPLFPAEQLFNYYFSINLPIPLAQIPPVLVSHRLIFTDLKDGKSVTVDGGTFSPRLDEQPTVIASPVRGRNLVFKSHSYDGYHFNQLFFVDRTIFSGERFAMDTAKFDDMLSTEIKGDPAQNESYLTYNDPLYAVADGIVVKVVDGRAENHGDLGDAPPSTRDEYAGNYLVLDIGHGRYAHYAHLVPGSFRVREGEWVRKGELLASLGNSGKSTGPHLHFELTDGQDILLSRGVPFVLEPMRQGG